VLKANNLYCSFDDWTNTTAEGSLETSPPPLPTTTTPACCTAAVSCLSCIHCYCCLETPFVFAALHTWLLQAIGEDLFAIALDQPFRFPATFTFVLRAFSTLEVRYLMSYIMLGDFRGCSWFRPEPWTSEHRQGNLVYMFGQV
jgi:hypothetical protein